MKKQSQDYVVIGNGVGVLQLLLHPDFANSSLELAWKPTLPENDPSKFFIVSATHLLAPAFKGPRATLALKDILFFFDKTRRFSASEILFTETLPLAAALRKKLIALSLFNDLSPLVWDDQKETPIFNWNKRQPLTLQNIKKGMDLSLSIVPQQALLKEFTRLSPKSGRSPEQVLSIKIDRSQNQGILSFAPPLQAESFRQIICTDYFQIDSNNLELKAKPVALWQSFLGVIPRSRISALPFFSIWTDEKSDFFIKTGHIQDQCLKRVLVFQIPGTENCSVQIQVLRTDLQRSPIPHVQKFLYSLCPRLESFKTTFEDCVLEDDLIFPDPGAIYEKQSPNLSYWNPGSLGGSPEFFRKILRQFKIKASAAPLNTSGTP